MKKPNFIFLFPCPAILAVGQNNYRNLKSKFADFDGGKVHYYDPGKGRNALVFIHGWTCSADFLNRNLEKRSDKSSASGAPERLGLEAGRRGIFQLRRAAARTPDVEKRRSFSDDGKTRGIQQSGARLYR
jgi:hypothetical protein